MARKIITIVILSLMTFCASISGVFASWQYVENTSFPVNHTQNVVLSEFVFAPEEILPSVTPGQNYIDLHQSILENNKGGLNSSKDALEKAIFSDADGVLHSSQNISGGNLKHLFITEASKQLSFIAEYISNSEIAIYMYETDDAETGAIGVTRIQVYKTIYIKNNGTWAAKETQLGTALVQYFVNTSTVAIGVSSWTRQL